MTTIEITKKPIEEIKNFPRKYGEGYIKSRGGKIYWVFKTLPTFEIKFRGDGSPL